jgi:spermidine synthase
MEKIIYEASTRHHEIKVIEENNIRKMMFGKGYCSEQSAIDLSDQSIHVFDYSFLAMHSLLFCNYPSKILMIGLGGGVVPRKMSELLPDTCIDIFEIDEEVLKISKEFFNFKESSKVKVHIGDAFDLIKNINNKYDIIFIDAYTSSYIPFHIMSKEFFDNIYNCLSDDGVVANNVANFHILYRNQINTIYNVFGESIYGIDGYTNPFTTTLFVLKRDRSISIPDAYRSFRFTPQKILLNDDIKSTRIISVNDEGGVLC